MPGAKTERHGISNCEPPVSAALHPHSRLIPAAVCVAVLCTALFAPALFASSALADRGITATMTGFNNVSSVAFDSNQNAWITDKGTFNNPLQPGPGQNGVYKFDPFPSQTGLATPSTFSAFGAGYILSLDGAVDDATDEVFVSQSNGRSVYIFAPASETVKCKRLPGETYCYTHKWTKINSANACFNCVPDIHIAIDNTNTYSNGRVYLSLTSPEDDVEVFDSNERRVDFPATASYIENSKLTGTPSGPFGQVGYVAVDANGNIYVTDDGKHLIDEFESSGTFLRSLPAPRAAQGYPGTGGVGIDPTNGNVLIAESNFNPEDGSGGVREFDSSGNYLRTLVGLKGEGFQPEAPPGINSAGYAYVPSGEKIDIFTPAAVVPTVTYKPISSPSPTAGAVEATINPTGGGEVTECVIEYGADTSYGSGKLPCQPATHFVATTEVSVQLTGLKTDQTYHYRVVVHNADGVKYGEDRTYTPHDVIGLETGPAKEVTENGAEFTALW